MLGVYMHHCHARTATSLCGCADDGNHDVQVAVGAMLGMVIGYIVGVSIPV